MKLQHLVCGSLFTLLTLLVTIQPASADIHQGRNVLGLSTEASGDGVFELVDCPTGDLQLHLMVYGYNHTQGIMAWDCAVVLPGGVILANTNIMGHGVNCSPYSDCFSVTTSEPLMPVDGMIHLATLNLVVTDATEPQDIYLAPAPIWGNVGGMEFSRATDQSLRQLFNWPSGCNDCPVFCLTDGIQAADNPSLDWIKSVFR